MLTPPPPVPGEGGEGGEEEEELDEDVRERLSEDEEELRAYLLHGDPLSDETTEKMASQFWNTEPYKSVAGGGVLHVCTRIYDVGFSLV